MVSAYPGLIKNIHISWFFKSSHNSQCILIILQILQPEVAAAQAPPHPTPAADRKGLNKMESMENPPGIIMENDKIG